MAMLLERKKQDDAMLFWAAGLVQNQFRRHRARHVYAQLQLAHECRWKQVIDTDNAHGMGWGAPFYYVRASTPILHISSRVNAVESNQWGQVDASATVECSTCSEYFCPECFARVHDHGKRQHHVRRQLYNYYHKRIEYGDGEFPSVWPSEIDQDRKRPWDFIHYVPLDGYDELVAWIAEEDVRLYMLRLALQQAKPADAPAAVTEEVVEPVVEQPKPRAFDEDSSGNKIIFKPLGTVDTSPADDVVYQVKVDLPSDYSDKSTKKTKRKRRPLAAQKKLLHASPASQSPESTALVPDGGGVRKPFLRRKVDEASPETGSDGLGKECARHTVVEGEVCAICREDMVEAQQNLTYCKRGSWLMNPAVKILGESRKQAKENIICPLCRQDWGDSALTNLKKEADVSNRNPLAHKGTWFPALRTIRSSLLSPEAINDLEGRELSNADYDMLMEVGTHLLSQKYTCPNAPTCDHILFPGLHHCIPLIWFSLRLTLCLSEQSKKALDKGKAVKKKPHAPPPLLPMNNQLEVDVALTGLHQPHPRQEQQRPGQPQRPRKLPTHLRHPCPQPNLALLEPAFVVGSLATTSHPPSRLNSLPKLSPVLSPTSARLAQAEAARQLVRTQSQERKRQQAQAVHDRKQALNQLTTSPLEGRIVLPPLCVGSGGHASSNQDQNSIVDKTIKAKKAERVARHEQVKARREQLHAIPHSAIAGLNML
ncbi:hypothetical protein DYB32_001472 [Aphanomyces invadans]|uniref:Uncharacterized protein n=1 Tax=Aphanomyces invadans TaxID=157072 RepID=A0A418B6J5_9STRA|nr:hypothetical protein DYB32_001472 [Aphanomyces invadans]